MTWTRLFGADLRHMSWMAHMQFCHLSGRKDVQIRFSLVPVSKTLTVFLSMFDVILTHI